MFKVLQKKWWQILLLIFAAVFSVSASRIFSPLDAIKTNTKINIEQAKDIEVLMEKSADIKETMNSGFERLQKSQETYFEILNDKIDYITDKK